MRKNGKRLASFLLALVMIFSLLPTEVLASGLDEPIEGTTAPIVDVAAEPAGEPADEPVEEPATEPAGEPEIGRASCRERV